MKNKYNLFNMAKQFIKEDESLPEDIKLNHLTILEQLTTNQVADLEMLRELNEYFDDQIFNMEESAIRNRDSDLLSQLADIRNARTELENALFMLYTDDSQNNQPLPQSQDKPQDY